MSALQHSQRAINANFDPPNFPTLNKSLSPKAEKTQVIRSPISETFANLFQAFKTLINGLFGFALRHFVALYDQLDPIRVEATDNNLECQKKFNKVHYVFAFLVSATFDLYGTFGFHLEHGGRITAEEMAASPYTFSHQVSAPLIWAQVDSTWSLNCTTTLVILFLMSVISEVSETFVLCRRGERLYLGGKELHPEEAAAILKLSKTMKLPLLLFILTFLVSLTVYFLLNVYVNDVYERNWRSVFWWLIVFPVFLFYLLYALFGQIMPIILSVRYISVKQKLLLKRLTALNASLEAFCIKRTLLRFNNNTVEPNKLPTFFLSHFLGLNRHLVFTCKYIRAYSVHFSPIISTIVPFYIAVQCHLFFVTAFKEVPYFEKYIYSLSGGECNFFLFLVTHECAHIVSFNNKLEKELAKFNFLFTKHFRLSNGRAVSTAMQLEFFAKHRRLQPYSFKIFSNFRITSKTYYMVISYICLIFMFLIKDFYKQH